MAICPDQIIDQAPAVTSPCELRIAFGLVTIEPDGASSALASGKTGVAVGRVKLYPAVILLDAGLYPDVRQVWLVAVENVDGSVIIDGEFQVVAFDVVPVL